MNIRKFQLMMVAGLFAGVVSAQTAWCASIEVLQDEGELVVRDSNQPNKVIRSKPVSGQAYSEELKKTQLNKGETAGFEPSNPRVEFRDSSGKTFKTISLKTDSKVVPVKTEEREVKSKYITEKSVTVTKDKQYMLLAFNSSYCSDIDEKGNEKLYNDREITGRLEFYDANGKLLWEKQMPEGASAGYADPVFSENGEVVYVPTGLPDKTVYVFNAKGDLLLSVPWGSRPVFSSNGKYLALRVAGRPSLTHFYNLANVASWMADKEYVVYGISNTGQVRADTPGADTPVINIELNEHLGQ